MEKVQAKGNKSNDEVKESVVGNKRAHAEISSVVSESASTTVPTSSSTSSNQNTDQSSSTNNRARLGHGTKSHETTQKAAHVHRLKERGHNQVMTDIYVNLVGEMMYPKTTYGLYGYAPEDGRFPIEKVNTLGYLLNPLRKRSVIEKWSPYEIAVFEASISLHGKNFHTIQKNVETKNCKEIIEFYYEWKKTNHYKEWKKLYFPDERDFQ